MAAKFRFEPNQDDPVHYYATSAAEWRVNENPEELIAAMKRSGYSFAVYRVALPIDAQYRIENYVPVVDADKLARIGAWRA